MYITKLYQGKHFEQHPCSHQNLLIHHRTQTSHIHVVPKDQGKACGKDETTYSFLICEIYEGIFHIYAYFIFHHQLLVQLYKINEHSQDSKHLLVHAWNACQDIQEALCKSQLLLLSVQYSSMLQ